MTKSFSFLLLLFSFYTLGQSQSVGDWEQVYDNNPDRGVGVAGGVIVNPTDSNIVFVYGGGALWKSTNRGDSWNLYNENTTEYGIYNLTFDPTNGNIIWAQINYELHKSVDGGNTWSSMNQTLDGFESPILIDPTNGNNITVHNNSGIYKSTNGGLTWVQLSTVYASMMVMNPQNPNTLYALPVLKKSLDGGATWTTLTVPPTTVGYSYVDMAMTTADTNYIYLYGSSSSGNAQIAYSTNGGSNFILQPLLTNITDRPEFANILVSQTNKNSLCIGAVGFHRSSNSGSSFTNFVFNNLHVDHRFIGIDNFNTLWSGNDGGVYLSYDFGITWINKTSNLNIHYVEDLSSSEIDSAVFSVGLMHDFHKIKTSTGWKSVFAGDGFNTAMHPTNPQVVFGRNQYDYYKTLDGGITTNGAFVGLTESTYSFFSEFPLKFNLQNPNSLFFLVDNVWRGSVSGTGVVRISNFPASYSSGSFLYVCDTDSNTIYTAYYKTVDGGANWTTNSKLVIAVDPDEPNKVWARTGTVIYFSSDGGNTWIPYPMQDIPMKNYKAEPANNMYNGIYIYIEKLLYYIDDRLSNWQDLRTGLPKNITFTKLNVLENFNLARLGTYGRGVWESPTYSPDSLVAQVFSSSTSYSSSAGCVGDTIHYFDNSISSGLGLGSTYAWSFSGGSPSSSTNVNQEVVYSTPGTYPYSLTVTNFLGTSTYYDTITISGIIPDLSIGSNSPVCPYDTLFLNATTSSGGNFYWSGPSPYFSSNLEDPIASNFNGSMVGNYICQLDLNGCVVRDTVNVALYQIPSVSVSNTGPYCAGGTIQLNATSIPGASYSWTGPNGFTSSLQNPTLDSITAIHAGSYCLKITTDGCQSSNFCTTVSLVAPPTPVSSVNYCAGQTVYVTPGGSYWGSNYSWTGPNGFTSTTTVLTIPNSNATMSGIYTVQKDGCHILGTVNVSVYTVPTAPIVSNSGPYCSGDTVQLYATSVGATSYSWTGTNYFNSTLQNPSFIGTTSGVYQVYGINGTCPGPSTSMSVVVNLTPSNSTLYGPTMACTNSTLNLSANNVAGATYTWAGPISIPNTTYNVVLLSPTPSMSGLYSVYITSAQGCVSPIATKNIVINQNPNPGYPSNTGPYCVGNTIQLNSVSSPGVTFQWSGPLGFNSTLQNPTIPNATTNRSGYYSVTLSKNGCSSSFMITDVLVNPIPAIPAASNTGPFCEGDTIELNTPLVSGATYEWIGPNGFTSTLRTPTILNSTAAMGGIYLVQVIVNGCYSQYGATNVVIIPPPAAPISSNTGAYCEGDTIQLNATLVSGTTYEWTGPSGFTSTSQNPSIPSSTSTMSGIYQVRTELNGCYSPYNSTSVTVNPTPQITLADTSILCLGDTLFLSANSIPNGNYSWTGPALFSSQQQDPVLPNVQAANSGYYYLAIELNTCQSNLDSTFIAINPIPSEPTASNSGAYCEGDPIQLNATLVSGTTYEWTGPSGFTSTSQNPSIPSSTPAMSGIYQVRSELNGCYSPYNSTSVAVNPTPQITLADSSTTCLGDTLFLSANSIPNGNYSWTGPALFSSQLQEPIVPNVLMTNAGYYYLVVELNACQSTIDSTFIAINEIPNVSTFEDTTICIGSSITLSATGALNYSWDNGLGIGNNFLIDPISNSTYIVTGLDSNNCSDTDTVEISIANDPNIVFILSTDSICSISGSIDLIASPSGGVFIGNGVTGNQFDPSAANVGVHTISYQVTTSDSCEFESTQQIQVLNCANIDSKEIQELLIYPNPTSNQLTIISNYAMLSVSLIDIEGRLIFKEGVNNTTIDLELKDYANGVYYIVIEQEFESFIEKIIIQR